jgi:hypothetical protein
MDRRQKEGEAIRVRINRPKRVMIYPVKELDNQSLISIMVELQHGPIRFFMWTFIILGRRKLLIIHSDGPAPTVLELIGLVTHELILASA